jgi:glycosyltransferase involved in cell wall biosynthesis
MTQVPLKVSVHMVVWKYFPVFEGGAERQCRMLTSTLSAKGLNCTVLTSWIEKKLLTDEQIRDGSRVRRIGSLAWLETWTRGIFRRSRKFLAGNKVEKLNDPFEFWFLLPVVLIARLSFILQLRSYLRRNKSKIDVLHVHEAHWIAGAVAWASAGLEIPVVCKEASFPVVSKLGYDTPMRKTLTAYRKKVHFIAMTEVIYQGLLETGIQARQISIIPNGVEFPDEQAEFIGSQEVIYIGNMSQGTTWKAFDILFEAWRKVAKQNSSTRMVVLGAGDPTVWKQYLSQNNCLQSVNFIGAVSDVSVYLKRARLFVLPSRVEGLSNALLEAMSWGVPVVISDIDAHRSLVQHELNGLVVPVNDSEMLAQSILRLLEDDALCKHVATNARSTIMEKYEISMVSSLMIKLYTSLLCDESSFIS